MMKNALVTLWTFVLLAFFVQDTLASSSSSSLVQQQKRTKVASGHVRTVNQPTVNKVPTTQRVTANNVSGWAKRLVLNNQTSTYAAAKNAAGTAPRYVAWGNYIVASSNSIGTPDPKTSVKGLTHFNLAFWVSNGGNASFAGDTYTGAGNAQEWAAGDSVVQRAIVREYNKYGIRLGVALFGAVDKPQTNGFDPTQLAQTIAAFVKKNNLQGVDIDYEEFDKLTDWSGSGATWLIALVKQLRTSLPRPNYYISVAPVAPLFNNQQFPNGFLTVHQQVGSLIDYYNVQFYNQQNNYATCSSLLTQSNSIYPNSSLSQIINMWGVTKNKVVIGKPAHTEDAITYTNTTTGVSSSDGYMTPKRLSTCLKQARKLNNWRGGVAWWQYKGQLQDVIPSARSAINYKTT